MKLFLDDIRNPVYILNGYDENEWTLITTAEEAFKIIESGIVTHISFDHDLGTKLTGYDVAKHIEMLVVEGKINMPIYYVHSANPVGSKNIIRAMESASKYAKH